MELFPLPEGGYIADTAGFSSLNMEMVLPILPDNLPFCFREFLPLLGTCRFASCRHVKETGCAIKAALEAGEIAPSRYESYVAMLEDAKKLPEWQLTDKS